MQRVGGREGFEGEKSGKLKPVRQGATPSEKASRSEVYIALSDGLQSWEIPAPLWEDGGGTFLLDHRGAGEFRLCVPSA